MYDKQKQAQCLKSLISASTRKEERFLFLMLMLASHRLTRVLLVLMVLYTPILTSYVGFMDVNLCHAFVGYLQLSWSGTRHGYSQYHRPKNNRQKDNGM